MSTQCAKRVYAGTFTGRHCSRPAMPGKAYCRQHDPELVKRELEKAHSPYAQLVRVKQALRELSNEINCRRQHGVEGDAHLEFVERKLREIIGDTPATTEVKA